ncbi:potassium voltage-gated channel protein Shab isoform X1 [Folsomia candida]|uniref:potassium voltage-gated channel protein Shab isoform X1 n=2 Tax=Folsomia candida TaxID=158441 RepID=UPI001604A21F|nr:potassium voltage-gated channel protein Shab isoform X1 [Folsomia candida]XP_035706335.1 potassium voltage-gated channel protein Shab isoform X1 [Folsomia candida]
MDMRKEKDGTPAENVTLVAAKPLRSSLNKGNTSTVSPIDSSGVTPREGWVADPSSARPSGPVSFDRKKSWTGTVIPSPAEIAESMDKHRRVILNVGGERHEILWANLERHPYTRLGQLGECSTHEEIMDVCDDYDLNMNEYYWDRQPRSFSLILNLYRKNKLHFPEDSVCVMDFADDLQYWGIDELYLDSCCQIKYQQKMEQQLDELKKDEEFLLLHKEEDFGKGMLAEYRAYLWDLFEKSTTLPQKITGMMSITIIVTSIVTLSLSTVPELQGYRCTHKNQTLCDEILTETLSSSDHLSLPKEYFEEADNEILDKIEIVCIAWFTFEYIIRLFAAPKLSSFFREWLNNIDLLAIAPFYVSLFLVQFDTPGRVLQVLRVIRILRIFKLARHSTGLQSLGFTLRHSYKNLGVLLLFLTVGVVIFSTLAYFAERDANKDGFESIPHAFYWALITMTTVGYGDITPKTVTGKIIGMATGICGVIVIALPIPIIVNNFGLFYEEQKRKEKSLKRQKAIQDLKDSEHSNQGSYLKVTIRNPLGLDEKKDDKNTPVENNS